MKVNEKFVVTIACLMVGCAIKIAIGRKVCQFVENAVSTGNQKPKEKINSKKIEA